MKRGFSIIIVPCVLSMTIKIFFEENRQIFFDGNECLGSSILIESMLLLKKNVNVILSNNKFKYSRLDNVLLSEIKYSQMEIKNNVFENNKTNGLKIKRCFNNEEKDNKIIINNNIFQNSCEIKINSLKTNKADCFLVIWKKIHLIKKNIFLNHNRLPRIPIQLLKRKKFRFVFG